MTRIPETESHWKRQSSHERVLASVKHAIAEGRYEGSMLPSYRQLARELNVTRGSVEWAMAKLEREGLIRREDRRGVFPCAQTSLATGKGQLPIQCVNFVAASFACFPSFVEADYLAGYTEALDYVGIRMRFVAKRKAKEALYTHLFSPILPMKAQGIILINEGSSEVVEWLRRNKVLFVLQHNARYVTQDLPPHVGVYVNKSGGTFQAVKHLLELGHRRIGFMGSVKPSGPGMTVMFDGYRAALVSVGMDCVESDLLHCEAGDRQASFVAAKTFLECPRRPSAILASSDEYAFALLEAAQALNLRVPEDLSIVGFDNQLESAETQPALTTVSVPRLELAKSAVELLLETAENPDLLPRTRILETHLIIRGTTAPPGAMQ